MEQTESILNDSTAALAAALRIFAARGRAIRAEQAQQEESTNRQPESAVPISPEAQQLPSAVATIAADQGSSPQ